MELLGGILMEKRCLASKKQVLELYYAILCFLVQGYVRSDRYFHHDELHHPSHK